VAAVSDPFKAESDYAPSYVTGPNGFRFQCYNAVEMARQLNELFAPSAEAQRLSRVVARVAGEQKLYREETIKDLHAAAALLLGRKWL